MASAAGRAIPVRDRKCARAHERAYAAVRRGYDHQLSPQHLRRSSPLRSYFWAGALCVV